MTDLKNQTFTDKPLSVPVSSVSNLSLPVLTDGIKRIKSRKQTQTLNPNLPTAFEYDPPLAPITDYDAILRTAQDRLDGPDGNAVREWLESRIDGLTLAALELGLSDHNALLIPCFRARVGLLRVVQIEQQRRRLLAGDHRPAYWIGGATVSRIALCADELQAIIVYAATNGRWIGATLGTQPDPLLAHKARTALKALVLSGPNPDPQVWQPYGLAVTSLSAAAVAGLLELYE